MALLFFQEMLPDPHLKINMISNEHYMAVDSNTFEEFYEREKKEFRDLYKDFIKYQQKVVEQGNKMIVSICGPF